MRTLAESQPLLTSNNELAINVNGDSGPMGEHAPLASKVARLTSIDLLRGVIMIIMAWDHSKDLLANYKGNDETGPHHGSLFGVHSESYAGPLELYRGQPAFLFARFISHFCAPGFSLLMGLSMVLLSHARRTKAGWSSFRLLRFFILRGFILIVLGFAVRGALLIELIHPSPRMRATAGHPAAEHEIRGLFQVMTALGMQMICNSLILETLHQIEKRGGLERFRLPLGGPYAFFRFNFQPLLLFLLGSTCIVITTIIVHHAQHGDPSTAPRDVAVTFPQLLNRFFLLPGLFGDVHSQMIYPMVPWLGLCLWGSAMGFEFRKNSVMAHQRALLHGCLLLTAFPLIRFFGGKALNMRGLPMGEGKEHPWNAWWTVCKYPPSFAYISITIGADLVGLFLLSLVKADAHWWSRVVLPYGRSPLAFYISHWWILSTMALIIYSTSGWAGVPLPAVIPLWMTVIFIEYFIVRWYDKFKQSKSQDSLWRLL